MGNKETMLESGKITPTLVKLAIPLIISQLINVLYNIVDRIYIGKIEGADMYAISGVGVAFPIILIVSAFASLFGVGGAPLAAIKLGEKDKKGAEKIIGNSFISLIVTGIILTILTLTFSDQLLKLFSATPNNIQYASDYVRMYTLGTVAVMIAFGMNAYITAQGKTMIAMVSVTIGAVMNIILDPIVIFTLGMGVKGAALASVISQVCSATFVLFFLLSKNTSIRLKAENFKPSKKIILSIAALGISPFIMQATEAFVTITLNNQVTAYAPNNPEFYTGLNTVFISLMQLVLLPISGFAQGGQSLISYNYGAGNIDRVKQTIKSMFIIGLSISLVAYCVLALVPEAAIKLFKEDPWLLEHGPRYLRIFFLGTCIFGAQITLQNSLLALRQPIVSLILALLRKVVLLIPLAIILPIFLGIDGVYIAEPIADATASIATTIVFMSLIKKILAKRELELNK